MTISSVEKVNGACGSTIDTSFELTRFGGPRQHAKLQAKSSEMCALHTVSVLTQTYIAS